jgi:hypothetical protein
MHAKITDGTAAKFPYTDAMLRSDLQSYSSNISLPRRFDDAFRRRHGVNPVVALERPDVDSGQTAVRREWPELQNDQWVLGWTVRDKTAEELATEIESLRARMYQQVRDAYSRAMSVISKGYPAEEREGWPEQIEAARDVLNGNENPLIDALRALTGETGPEMANTIIAKRKQYQVLYGGMTAKRRFLYEQIGAAAGLSELEAIDVEEIWND